MIVSDLDSSLIIVGLSGGVDSSVSAYLLQRAGYRVEGLFMKNWDEDDGESYCTAEQDLADAQAVCDKLNIPLHTVSFSEQYWSAVFENFLSEYEAGRTPNPDILCNREIKFKAFLNYARELGASKIATGHYAQVKFENQEAHLLRGQDRNKDQSYFLYAIGQEALEHALFPIGHLDKAEVRTLAESAGLVTHDKKDSTGICFIGERRFSTFLSRYLPAQPGEIRSIEGEYLGQHNGLMYYTLGQRKGIRLGGQSGKEESPWYVIDKDLKTNTLIVGQGHDHPQLYRQSLVCDQLVFFNPEDRHRVKRCTAKSRYRQPDQGCSLYYQANNQLIVEFDHPQRAITPGQSIVFYQNEYCLGGGIIL